LGVTRQGYIGKEKDVENGLGDHGVRKYDYETGRFNSIDPLWEKYYGWSPYQYCMNNPIWAKDWDGREGKLTIYANGGGIQGGHAWITYTPTNGTTTSYGTWGNNPDGKGYGLLKNVELDYGMTTAEATRTLDIDDNQEKSLFKTIDSYEKKGSDAWKLLGPCSKFAQDAWQSGTSEYLNANTWVIINNPETLKQSIIEANGGVPHNTDANNNINNESSDKSSGSTSASSGNSSNSSVQSSFIKIPD